ncbi:MULTISPECIES: FeoC-like transcriptional regulator [Oceanobacillus]|uniref:FeoC-like transcriptional regulator n=1 Tax=Oceanobacillus TaxID=182709 RepID=UPI0030F9BACD|nr:hypothetical protein [Oceanobacillus sp.]
MKEFVRNCRLCKEPMKSSPFMMCPTCLRDSEQVRNFVQKNPHVSLAEISRYTKVSLEKVEDMVYLGHNRKGELESELH